MQNYAKLYEPLLGNILKDLRKKVLAHALPQSSDMRHYALMDCCCGAGGLLRLMSERMQGQGLLLGLDIDSLMLNESRHLAPEAHLLLGSAIKIPLATQSLQAATICMALHAMPHGAAVRTLRELRRVAQRVVIVDYCLAERNIWLPAVWLGHAVEKAVGGTHYRCYKRFMQLGGLEGLLQQENVEVQERCTVLGGCARLVVI